MFIVSADRNNIVNVDNVVSIGIDGKKILAMTAVDDIILGSYRNEERSKEIYAVMLKEVFPPSTLVLQNCTMDKSEYEKLKEIESGVICVCGEDADIKQFDCGVFYMPEE